MVQHFIIDDLYTKGYLVILGEPESVEALTEKVDVLKET